MNRARAEGAVNVEPGKRTTNGAGGEEIKARPDEASRFLEALRPGGPWVLTAIFPDGWLTTDTVETASGVRGFIQQYNGDMNVYYSVNPLRRPMKKKAAKIDVAAIEYLPVDLDPRADENSEAAKARYMRAIEECGVEFAAIVDSGNGIQGLIKLDAPIALGPLVDEEIVEKKIVNGKTVEEKRVIKVLSSEDQAKVDDAEARAKALALRLGGTVGTQNIDRILRLPGTVNHPNEVKRRQGRTKCLARLIAFDGATVRLEDLPKDSANSNGAGDGAQGGTTFDPGGIDDIEPDDPRLAGLSPEWIKIAYEGDGIDPDRSKTVFAFACECIRLGVRDDAIASCLMYWPIGEHVRDQPDVMRALNRTIRRAHEFFGASQQQTTAGATSQVVLVRAIDVVPRPKDWIWDGHILRGALGLITGTPGVGKSQVHCYIVARATTGQGWPCGGMAVAAMNVIMVTAEDTLDQELIPRLIAAGADRERVHILKCIKTDPRSPGRQFLLEKDLDRLKIAMRQVGDVGLITLDPINAYMGGKIDSHKATEVRSQLGPLKDFAEECNIAVSAITHPAKNAGPSAINHFIGSQAFIAAARIGDICCEEVDDDEGRPTGRILFANRKNSGAPTQPTLAYRIGEIVIDQGGGGNIAAPRIAWDAGTVDVTADQAIARAAAAARADGRDHDGEQRECRRFLREFLADGQPKLQEEIMAEGDQRGFTPRQLKRAKQRLGIVSQKGTGSLSDKWYWVLPVAPF